MPTNPVLRDILLGALLALFVVVLLVAVTYAFLALRGTFSNPSVPRTLGLVVFALLHGGAASVNVPPIPSLFGIGGSATLGLPVSSFALFPFIVLLVTARYVAQRAHTAGIFASAMALAYAVIVGLLAALGSGSVASGDEITIEFAADPISTAMRALLLAGLGATLGAAVSHGPLLPTRVRQVIWGSLVAIGISVGLTLLLAASVVLTSLLGADGPGQQATDWPSLDSESGTMAEALTFLDDALAFLGVLIALLPWALGTLWLLAHGVPVGFQDVSSLSELPLVGPALADVPLRVSLLGTWPWGAAWRLLLLGPIVGFVVGGMLATRGAPPKERWWQGALVALPYALIAVLVALFARLAADLTLAGATLSITLGASLPWLLFLLPVGGVLGALGGYLVKDGEPVPAAHPRRTFLLTGIIGATVLLLSLPSLIVFGSLANRDLVGSSIPGSGSPLDPPPPKAVSTQGESAAAAESEGPVFEAPPSDSESSRVEQPEAERQPVVTGETVTVGDVEWTVDNARRENRIRAQSRDVLRGDFVIVNFNLTNNSDEQVTLNPSALGLIGGQGRRFEVLPDMSRYVPPDRDPFSQSVDPGATLEGRAVFSVEPGVSGFRLQVGDGRLLSQENGYVDLGL